MCSAARSSKQLEAPHMQKTSTLPNESHSSKDTILRIAKKRPLQEIPPRRKLRALASLHASEKLADVAIVH
jgi:hypothetical protein